MIQEITDLPVCLDCAKDLGTGGTYGEHPWLTGSPNDVPGGPYGNCGLLYQVILDIQTMLQSGRFTQAGYIAKRQELDTAWAKWEASNCTLIITKVPIDPIIDPIIDPKGGGGTGPIDPLGGGGAPIEPVDGGPITPVGGGDDANKGDNGNGLPFQTLSGAGGGNNGAGGAVTTSAKHRNYFWIVVGASLVAGFILFGKNNIAGQPV